jgi:hypothetical protein
MPGPFPGMDPYLEGRRIWPDVHARLIVAVGDALAPLVEPAYYVAVEERVYITRAEPEERIVPDVAVIAAPGPLEAAGGLAVAVATAVAVEAQMVTVPLYETVRESFLEIRDIEGNELVTSIEILSPSNKKPGAGRREYEAKRRQVFESRTSLVEIDLLRAGRPLEIHPSPPSDYRILVLAGWEYPRAQLLAFNLPQPIPDVPVPLKEGEAPALLPLGRLLNEVYDRARYARRVRYHGPVPEPPLAPEAAAWVDALLREKGQRADRSG